MRIATWNVNGIRAREAQVLAWVKEERLDVICLQEIKASPDKVPPSLRELPGYWSYWHGAKGYSGVGLLVAKDFCPAQPVFSHPPFDMENRIVIAMIGDIAIASVYVPNGGKDFRAKMRFLSALEEYTSDTAGAGLSLVLCGDVNIARTEMDVHPKERQEVIGQLPVERNQFEKLLAAGLVDVGRMLDPTNEELFTWWAPWRQMRQRNIGWRLDYILASPSLRPVSCAVQSSIGTSDHAPVVATLEW